MSEKSLAGRRLWSLAALFTSLREIGVMLAWS
jgi:hypothetical protein